MSQQINLKKTIDNIYNSITTAQNFKDIGVEEFYDILNSYESLIEEETRKRRGSYYTSSDIVRFILENVLKKTDVSLNPYVKIFDPSCGCGYFLTEAYELLEQKFLENLETVNRLNPGLNLNKYNLHEHILKHNIFGADVDEMGVKLTTLNLMLKGMEHGIKPNIICCDSLINWEDTILPGSDLWKNRFDIIIGNPPYIGHKKVSGQYRKTLNNLYGDIFKDKADISFCFIKSSIDRLAEGGRLSFITSRYFMESPSGKALREFIKENCTIERIIDFYGVRIMKGISVDPVIIVLSRPLADEENQIEVFKAEVSLKKSAGEDVFAELKNKKTSNYKHFFIPQRVLSHSGWTLCPPDEMRVIKKIEDRLKYRLSHICTSYQGIITGCDKAFIVDDAIVDKHGIERDLLRRWIKNSNIKKYTVEEGSQYIIYTDFIGDEYKYEASLSYISRHREKLEKRRECIRGARKWYQLQWGRDSSQFEARKIIFPYKSSCNRFAIDEGSYASADVYGLILKESYVEKISYEFLLGLLNSKLYEFYFKSYGKKLGDDLYDYYPNTVMRLLVPIQEDEYITSCVEKILGGTGEEGKAIVMKEIDRYIYNLIGLEDCDIEIVEEMVSKH